MDREEKIEYARRYSHDPPGHPDSSEGDMSDPNAHAIRKERICGWFSDIYTDLDAEATAKVNRI